MDSDSKETLYLALIAEFAIILTIFLILFTASGGWYKMLLFDSIECQDWYKISKVLREEHDSRIPENLKGQLMSFDEKVSKWLEYCN